MTFDALPCGVLRAGGWGNGFKKLSHAALNEGGAGTQSLARSISSAVRLITGSHS